MTYQSELSYINLCLECSSFNYTNVKAFNTVNLFDCESVTFCVFSKTIFISTGYVDILYSTQRTVLGVYRNHPACLFVCLCPFVHISCKCYFSCTDTAETLHSCSIIPPEDVHEGR